MKIFGKYYGGYNSSSSHWAVGSYLAFDAEWVNVETYSGRSVEEDTQCLLRLGTAYLITNIKKSDGSYLTPEVANSMVRDIATKEILDLEKYDMGFYNFFDIRPDSLCIRNDVDEDYNAIPLKVVGV